MKKIQSDELDRKLVEAVRSNDLDIVSELVEEGANAQSDDSAPHDPLYTALELRYYKISNYLLNKGAKIKPIYVVNAIENEDIKLLKKLVELGAKLDHSHEFLDPIMVAMNADNLVALKYLVKVGADISKKMSPSPYLFTALERNCSDEIVDFLLQQKNLDLNATYWQNSVEDPRNGISPILCAIQRNKTTLALKLLKLGAKLPYGYEYSKKLDGFVDLNNISPIKKKLMGLSDKEFEAVLLDLVEKCRIDTVQEIISENEKKCIRVLNKASKSFSKTESKLMKHAIKYHAKFKFEGMKTPLIITSQNSKDESNFPHNSSNLKKKYATEFVKGEIYSTETNKPVKDCKGAIYVISKKGVLYTGPSEGIHHSYILKGKEGDELYGYGKPTACAGHLDIKKGKITQISNNSGHYAPNADQIKLACKHLKNQGVLDKKVVINICGDDLMTYDDLDKVVVGEILDQYAFIEY